MASGDGLWGEARGLLDELLVDHVGDEEIVVFGGFGVDEWCKDGGSIGLVINHLSDEYIKLNDLLLIQNILLVLIAKLTSLGLLGLKNELHILKALLQLYDLIY